jgi:hypothetical protein
MCAASRLHFVRVLRLEAERFVYHFTNVRRLTVRPGQFSGAQRNWARPFARHCRGSQSRGRDLHRARQPHPVFVTFRAVVGLPSLLKTGASDSEATAVQWRCQAKVVDRIAKCYAYFLLSVLSP